MVKTFIESVGPKKLCVRLKNQCKVITYGLLIFVLHAATRLRTKQLLRTV